ncbi:MAG TPA: thymidylate kinase [Candidatus Deferrimicrobiaceae bacterium]
MKKFYGEGLPGVDPGTLKGKLVVIEGPDGSGRSTQIAALTNWLEGRGYAVEQVGLKRSTLIGAELAQAKQGNILSPRTLSLFYATDFADQLENRIIPALRAGFIVLADRYIYTLMARDIVRGAEFEWLRSVYSIALVPDIVMYLRVTPQRLLERYIYRGRELDYWESGMDIGFSRSWYDSFIRYQTEVHREFAKLQALYGFVTVNGMRTPRAVTRDLQTRIEAVISSL